MSTMTEMTEAGIPQNITDCPNLQYFYKYVCAAGNYKDKWWDLGIELMGEDDVYLLDIIKVNSTDNAECCVRMFTEWRQRTPKASWKQLIEALKEINLTQLASELEELLIPPKEPSIEKTSRIPQQYSLEELEAPQLFLTASSLPDRTILAQKPDMHLLNKIVTPRIMSEWRDVAYSMGCPLYRVDAIQMESNNNLRQCCEKLFADWLKTSSNPTWKFLLVSIEDVAELTAAAETIQKELVSGNTLVERHSRLGEWKETIGGKLDNLSLTLKKCKENLKYYYLNKMDKKQSTRWPRLSHNPSLYIDVTIIRAQYSSSRMDNDSMERLYEEYAMGLLDNRADLTYVTIDDILKDGYGKVVLIQGDPGAGKTTLTFQLCEQWAKDEIPQLTKDVVVLIPLRRYKSFTKLHKLFDALGYPEIMEYAQQNNGKGLVLILDGWDELPNQLQESSLFHDIVFTNTIFNRSTIIVTSRPILCDEIARLVEERRTHYQILGFSPQKADEYIERYFKNNKSLQSAKPLLDFLKDRKNFRRHFYIPITVEIMCFVCKNDNQIPIRIPETLSKLYERFVMLHIRPNFRNTCNDAVKSLKTLPKNLKPVFDKLCKTAFYSLKKQELVFDEAELGITQGLLNKHGLEYFDGFGLLHVNHYTSRLATRERYCSFIHRAIQELLAANFILNHCNIDDILDKHFYKGSYLMNVFPFLFGLVRKELLRPLAEKLKKIFKKSNEELLPSILYCLFEAHDDILCHEFGQVFSEKREINLKFHTLLDCHYACYFITVCGVKGLNITMDCDSDVYCETTAMNLVSASTDIASFCFTVKGLLSCKGMEQFAKTISGQHNIHTVQLLTNCDPGYVKILCDSICKHNTQITNLRLPITILSENDLKSIGTLLATCTSLKSLFMKCSLNKRVCFDLLPSFCEGLCEARSLEKLVLERWNLSQADSKVFGDIISKNCSLKELHINVATVDCLDPILNGLSSNTSITTFRASFRTDITSDTLGECLEKCLSISPSLKILDFTNVRAKITWFYRIYPLQPAFYYISWSSTQVCSICTGLCANTTVVTLDISGCYIDTEACHAVCGMLSQNTTLQHLFLNPVQLDKQEAITMIESCRDNTILELLSLVQWPPKISLKDQGKEQGKEPFQYSTGKEVKRILQQIQKLRQKINKPLLNVYWKSDEYRKVKEQTLPTGL